MFGRKEKVINAVWIKQTHLFADEEYECSRCRKISDRPYIQCPHCNAEMTKIEDDQTWIEEAEMFEDMI